MSDFLPVIITMAAPLLFATLGALLSEHAGVLAVFMEGAISLSAFLCIAFTIATGNAASGFILSAAFTTTLLAVIAVYTEKTASNPFLSGLAVNLLSAGVTSLCSVVFFSTRGVIPLPADLGAYRFPLTAATLTAFASAPALAFVLHYTRFGLHLRITGSDSEVLRARGVSPGVYRIASWCAAAFFAACAGSFLALRLGAFVPNMSAGRGWTALAAVYLGYKKPLLCAGAVILFAGAEYLAHILQGTGTIPGSLILGLPYALSLIVFILSGKRR